MSRQQPKCAYHCRDCDLACAVIVEVLDLVQRDRDRAVLNIKLHRSIESMERLQVAEKELAQVEQAFERRRPGGIEGYIHPAALQTSWSGRFH